jgi:hypothetical protein
MSKILRRPMFRGGPVDSRGTGITSGLGYEAGGRVGFDIGGSPFLRTPIGGQIVEAQKKKPFLNFNTLNDLNYTAGLSEAYKKAKPLNSEDKTSVVDVVDESQEKEVDSKGSVIDESILDTDFDTTKKITLPDGSTQQVVTSDVEASPLTKLNLGMIDRNEYNEIVAQNKRSERGGRNLEEDAELSQAAYDARIAELAKVSDLDLNGEETPEISAKDAVRANQELFADLLGKSKARGQDISDMLLRFSGAEGDTVGEKFKAFTKLESAAGKGRAEKIDETAAALAIKDYIGGKRSKEQADIYKSRIDYTQKVKMDAVNVQPEDTAQQALFKIADKGDVPANSDAAYKYLIQIKDPSAKVFRNDKVKIKDLNKPNKLKKLKTGYNIIEEDGVKNVVVYNGSGDVTGIQVFSIGELWKS